VPDLWIRVSYLSLKSLPGFVEDLAKRLHFFLDWIAEGPVPPPPKEKEHKRQVALLRAPHLPCNVHELKSHQLPTSNDALLTRCFPLLPHARPPSSFWLSAFFYSQSFLIAIRQNLARRAKVPRPYRPTLLPIAPQLASS
jgi:hypothetical protein